MPSDDDDVHDAAVVYYVYVYVYDVDDDLEQFDDDDDDVAFDDVHASLHM